MTPKRRAELLFDKFWFVDSYDGLDIFDEELTIEERKKCVSIVVEEILDNYEEQYKYCKSKLYWEEVKAEIQNL